MPQFEYEEGIHRIVHHASSTMYGLSTLRSRVVPQLGNVLEIKSN
jgi:hypothetical protein